ncbi:hypothetical protein AB3466_22250 [Sphingobacterium thalpophilum]|uniref:hypothetical protein n=1 Tax=Sphingobacterium thalpophilum TaxID=259 RepID=UPI0037D9B14B
MKGFIIFCWMLFGTVVVSCNDFDFIEKGASDSKFLEQSDLFAISSSSSNKVKLESYFAFNSETKSCPDGSFYTDFFSTTIDVYGEYNSQSNNTSFTRDTVDKMLIKGMSPCAEEPWVPDTSQYSIYEPKPQSSYPGSYSNNFTIESIEFSNQSFFLNNPETLVKLREIYSISTNGVDTDYFYLGPYANETVQGAIFRFLSDLYIGYNTMGDLLMNVRSQFGFNSPRDLAFIRGYGHKFDAYPYDFSYPLDILKVIKFYSDAAERNLY